MAKFVIITSPRGDLHVAEVDYDSEQAADVRYAAQRLAERELVIGEEYALGTTDALNAVDARKTEAVWLGVRWNLQFYRMERELLKSKALPAGWSLESHPGDPQFLFVHKSAMTTVLVEFVDLQSGVMNALAINDFKRVDRETVFCPSPTTARFIAAVSPFLRRVAKAGR